MSELHDLELLAGYAASLNVTALPADAQRTAHACLLYGLAVGIATKRARPAQLAATALQMDGGGAAATRLIDGAATSRSNAVFAARNGLHVTDLIECGLIAAPTALHGKAGFYAAFGKGSGGDVSAVCAATRSK